MKKIMYFLLIILLIVLIAISSYFIYKQLKEENEQETIFNSLSEIIQDDTENRLKDNFKSNNYIKIQELYKENNDLIGWINIEDTNIDLGTIQNLIDNIKNFDQEPTVSFPQANNFERVINLCEMLQNSEKEKQEITNNYEFVSRQTNYYTDAAIYLGLIKKSGTKIKKFEITNLGKQILKLRKR